MKHFFHVPFVANCADSSSTFFGKVHTCQVKPFIIRLAAHKKPVFTEKKNVVDTDFILFHRFADFPWFISRAWRMQLWFQLILINLFSLFRWHRDIRVLFRPHWDSAVRECSAISVDGATTDLRPVEARRCEINDRTVSEVILIVDSFLFAFFCDFFCCAFAMLKKGKMKWQKSVFVAEPHWDVSASSSWLWWAWRGLLMCCRGRLEDRITSGKYDAVDLSKPF